MKLYYISQNENNGYDTHSDMVVVAESEDLARLVHPDAWGDHDGKSVWNSRHSTWCSSPGLVTVEYLGEAREGAPAGIICKSYHAG